MRCSSCGFDNPEGMNFLREMCQPAHGKKSEGEKRRKGETEKREKGKPEGKKESPFRLRTSDFGLRTDFG
jgi:hypothetical protein